MYSESIHFSPLPLSRDWSKAWLLSPLPCLSPTLFDYFLPAAKAIMLKGKLYHVSSLLIILQCVHLIRTQTPSPLSSLRGLMWSDPILPLCSPFLLLFPTHFTWNLVPWCSSNRPDKLPHQVVFTLP